MQAPRAIAPAPAPPAPVARRTFSRTLDLLAATACAGVVLALLVYGGGIWRQVGGLDLHAHLIPKYEYAARALRELRLPLWNPYEFCGLPLLATMQAAMLYPPVVLPFAVLPPWWALQTVFALHVLIFGIGMLAYLRRHGIGRAAGMVGVLLAAAGYFTEPALAAIDHPNFISCVAWLPVMLLCWEHAVDGRSWRWVGLLGLATGAQWLAGYPDYPMDSAVLLGTIALVDARAPLARRIGMLVAGLALGAVLAAVQLVPVYEGVQQGPRPDQEAVYASFRQLFAFRSTEHLGRVLMLRYGIAGLLLAGLALAYPQRRTVVAWLVALGWTLFALHPPLAVLYDVPPFTWVRMPTGWAHLGPVFLGMLAAAGLAWLWSWRHPVARATALLLAAATVLHGARAILTAPTAPSRRIAPDYALVEQRVARLEPLRVLGGAGPVRFLGLEELASGAALRHELPTPTGYEYSFPPRRVLHLLAYLRLYNLPTLLKRQGLRWMLTKADVAALLGVGVIVVPEREAPAYRRAGFVPVARLPPADVALYRAPLPRVRLVHRVIVVPAGEDELAALVAQASEAATAAVVADGVLDPDRLAPLRRDRTEHARIVVDEPECVVVEVEVASAALLVLMDSYYPGWQATVDGVPANILRVDYAFRGVLVGPGTHRVELRYRPTSLRVGAAVSGAGLLLVGGLLFVRRRDGGPRAP